MSDPILPCNLPCPQCGTTAVTRAFDQIGAKKASVKHRLDAAKSIHDDRISKSQALLDKVTAEYNGTPDIPRIQHSCMICKYTWDSEPLSKGAA